MVQLFVAQVYNETTTGISLTDQDEVIEALNNINFNTVTPTNISGFAYVQAATIEIEFLNDLVIDNTDPNSQRQLELDVAPVVKFSGVDVFPSRTPLNFFPNTEIARPPTTLTTAELTGSGPTVLDGFVDSGITCSAEITGFNEQNDMVIDGNQTIDISVTYSLVGRKP